LSGGVEHCHWKRPDLIPAAESSGWRQISRQSLQVLALSLASHGVVNCKD